MSINFKIPLIFAAIFSLVSIQSFAAAKPVLNIQTWKTTTDTPVYFVAVPQIPMLDIVVIFNAGSSRDGSLPGLASFTANMLNQGTLNLSADQIAKQFDDLGAIFETDTNR